MDQKIILVTLLVKLGVAAATASAVVRARYFQFLLFREERTLRQKFHLVLFVCIPLALGVWVRFNVKNFFAADLAFECSILMGVIAGRSAGVMGGILVSLPALAFGQFLALPVNVIVGFAAGFMRKFADPEEIWSFSPFMDMSVYRWLRRNLLHPRLDWQTSFFLFVLLLEVIRIEAGRTFPGRLFYIYTPHPWIQLAVFATTVAVVAVPLKIWNNTRIILKLEEQERLLLEARLDALQSQINPHFLFNTLNSISSLVRFDPDTARQLIVKLASILRRLLGKHDAFVHFREEVDFIDDYLEIEVVRFGSDKLRVIKDLSSDSLDVIVPSMLLQPLVENAIKHGLSARIDGGSIFISSRIDGEKLIIEVEDDGVGYSSNNVRLGQAGIGMANVKERLEVLYGEAGRMSIGDRRGGGTRVTLSVPVLFAGQPLEANSPAAAFIYDARSKTR